MTDLTPVIDATTTTPSQVVVTFDVDESIATLVMQHVGDPLDRNALAAVSRVWRRVAKSSSTSVTGLCAALAKREKRPDRLRRALS